MCPLTPLPLGVEGEASAGIYLTNTRHPPHQCTHQGMYVLTSVRIIPFIPASFRGVGRLF